MIENFERRLSDVLADALARAPVVAGVGRARASRTEPAAGKARVTVAVLRAAPSSVVGDDRNERLGSKGEWQLRPVLRLSGDVAIDVEVAPAGSRATLVEALDAVLLALHPESVRQGGAFETAEDDGFRLDGFRLAGLGAPDGTTALDGTQVRATYSYSGRFWPVEPAVTGDMIDRTIRRMAVLPALLPASVRTRAGGGEIGIPVELDLRLAGDAEPTLVARLLGSAPPGQLIGVPVVGAAGSVGYAPEDDRFEVRYRPPADVSAPARVRVHLELVGVGRPRTQVGQLEIEVVPA